MESLYNGAAYAFLIVTVVVVLCIVWSVLGIWQDLIEEEKNAEKGRRQLFEARFHDVDADDSACFDYVDSAADADGGD